MLTDGDVNISVELSEVLNHSQLYLLEPRSNKILFFLTGAHSLSNLIQYMLSLPYTYGAYGRVLITHSQNLMLGVVPPLII
mgnify:FL=1